MTRYLIAVTLLLFCLTVVSGAKPGNTGKPVFASPAPYNFPVRIEQCATPYALDRIPSNLPPQYQYSPAVCFRLDGLAADNYVFKFWLVETITPLEDRPDCAVPTLPKPNGPWCEKTVLIDNTGANFNSSHTLWVTDTTEIRDFPDFRIIVRVYDSSWKQAGWMTQIINGTLKRPITIEHFPELFTVVVNTTLTFTVNAGWVSPKGAYFNNTWSIINAPLTSTFKDRTFTWTPRTLGRWDNIIISAAAGKAGSVFFPLLFDSQKFAINVVRISGIPTPTPVIDKQLPEAALRGVIRTDSCRWLVRIFLKNFAPGARVNATSVGTFSDCQGVKTTYDWRSSTLLKIGPQGTLFVQLIHNDYGKYTYYFSDQRNRTAILPVSYGPADFPLDD